MRRRNTVPKERSGVRYAGGRARGCSAEEVISTGTAMLLCERRRREIDMHVYNHTRSQMIAPSFITTRANPKLLDPSAST